MRHFIILPLFTLHTSRSLALFSIQDWRRSLPARVRLSAGKPSRLFALSSRWHKQSEWFDLIRGDSIRSPHGERCFPRCPLVSAWLAGKPLKMLKPNPWEQPRATVQASLYLVRAAYLTHLIMLFPVTRRSRRGPSTLARSGGRPRTKARKNSR